MSSSAGSWCPSVRQPLLELEEQPRALQRAHPHLAPKQQRLQTGRQQCGRAACQRRDVTRSIFLLHCGALRHIREALEPRSETRLR